MTSLRREGDIEHWESVFPAAHQIYWQIRAGLEEMDGKSRSVHHRAAVLAIHDSFGSKSDRQRLGLPQTVRELAEKLGVSARSLRNYRTSYSPVFATTRETIRQSFINNYYGRVYEALGESASQHEHQHSADRRLFLQVAGDLLEKVEHSGGVAHSGGITHQFQNLSDEELYDALHSAMAQIVPPANGADGGASVGTGAA